jgi:hypothetical protein
MIILVLLFGLELGVAFNSNICFHNSNLYLYSGRKLIKTDFQGYKIYKMKPCNVTIVSNNFNSIQKFFLFFFTIKINFNTIKSISEKKKRRL